jgi:transposase
VERRKGQRHGSEFRRQAVEKMNACRNVLGLARGLGVSRRVLYQWRDRMEQTDSSPGRSRELVLRKQILNLKTIVSEQNFGRGFFQTCLAKSRGSTTPGVQFWRQGIYDEIRARMPLQGGLSVERMCQLTGVSRYRAQGSWSISKKTSQRLI